jgi:hypothetical protein
MGVDKLKLLMGRPITLDKDNDVKIHQPLISEIVDFGEDDFNTYTMPFVITTNSVFNGIENEEEFIQQYHIFDLFFIKLENGGTLLDNIFGRNALEVLRESLEYFIRADEIRILEKRQKIVVNNSYMIDKNEFDILRKVIQDVTGRKDVEVEKPPKNMTKRQADIWRKLQKGRKRTAEKNAIYLQDMISYTSLGGKSYISLDQIDRMTLFQFHNTYKSIMGKDAFDIGMGYKLSQKFEVKDEIKHWTETLKIGK